MRRRPRRDPWPCPRYRLATARTRQARGRPCTGGIAEGLGTGGIAEGLGTQRVGHGRAGGMATSGRLTERRSGGLRQKSPNRVQLVLLYVIRTLLPTLRSANKSVPRTAGATVHGSDSFADGTAGYGIQGTASSVAREAPGAGLGGQRMAQGFGCRAQGGARRPQVAGGSGVQFRDRKDG